LVQLIKLISTDRNDLKEIYYQKSIRGSRRKILNAQILNPLKNLIITHETLFPKENKEDINTTFSFAEIDLQLAGIPATHFFFWCTKLGRKKKEKKKKKKKKRRRRRRRGVILVVGSLKLHLELRSHLDP
jgi:hypothetical protein